MPTYEYQCQLCGHQLEAFQKMTDAALTFCPKCNQESLIKHVSAPAFQLKGSGWYKTDYAQPKVAAEKKDEGAKETKSESESAKSATKESDNKPSTDTKE